MPFSIHYPLQRIILEGIFNIEASLLPKINFRFSLTESTAVKKIWPRDDREL